MIMFTVVSIIQPGAQVKYVLNYLRSDYMCISGLGSGYNRKGSEIGSD